MRRLFWLALAAAGCSPGTDGGWFVECAQASGLSFVHECAPEHRYHFPEIMSGGVGLLDYDGDGWLDVYLVQGGDVAAPGHGPANALYRNRGEASFEDVSREAGVADASYGMGCACADVDGDGRTDLYVTNVGPNRLFRNRGDGTFADDTDAAGVGDPGFSSSAAFCDYDLDGDLDLFVANNVVWSAADDAERKCTSATSLRDYCSPNVYGPAPDTLYRNDGDGRFTDVSEAVGLRAAFGNGLGVVAADFDGNGWPDFYVANDGLANQLWLDEGGVRFQDAAPLKGCALSGSGAAEAGMGIHAVDIEEDGDMDVFITHLRSEKNTLYLNNGRHFQDASAQSRLSMPSRPYTGFGVGFADFDHDADLDLFVANGAVATHLPLPEDGDPYAEQNQLYEQWEPGDFREVLPRGGVERPLVSTSRGAAFGDLDNDGAVDVVIANRDGPVHLLQNRIGRGREWIGFRVLDRAGADAVGASVSIVSEGRTQTRQVNPHYSYCSSNDPRVHFGLAGARVVERVTVRWPVGTDQVYGPFAAGQYYILKPPED